MITVTDLTLRCIQKEARQCSRALCKTAQVSYKRTKLLPTNSQRQRSLPNACPLNTHQVTAGCFVFPTGKDYVQYLNIVLGDKFDYAAVFKSLQSTRLAPSLNSVLLRV
jgi:hypothetical protein